MNIKSLTGLAAVSFLLACQSDFYQIDGYAKDFKNGDTICLISDNNPAIIRQQTIVENGKFYFSGHTDAIRFCTVYVKHEPASKASLFLEPGHATVELHPYPALSRVSGTRINNTWQQLADSVELLSKGIFEIMHHPAISATEQAEHARTVDSLHRRMSDCILNTAQRNRNNPLGRYIEDHYKAPEFK